jgi:hypothetical protein
MNTKIHLLDARARQLADKIMDGSVVLEPLEAAAGELNHLLLGANTATTLARLRAQYADEYSDVLRAKGVQAAETLLGAIATLESAAQLGERDLMKIVAVIADGRTELAGSGISAFAGFFSREFREHDYWVGRVKTRVYLQRSDVKGILDVAEWPQEKTWGGADEAGVAAALKNPTSIVKLPLSLRDMMRPGIKSLLYAIRIRPALLRAAIIVFLLIAGSCVGLAFVICRLISPLHG